MRRAAAVSSMRRVRSRAGPAGRPPSRLMPASTNAMPSGLSRSGPGRRRSDAATPPPAAPAEPMRSARSRPRCQAPRGLVVSAGVAPGGDGRARHRADGHADADDGAGLNRASGAAKSTTNAPPRPITNTAEPRASHSMMRSGRSRAAGRQRDGAQQEHPDRVRDRHRRSQPDRLPHGAAAADQVANHQRLAVSGRYAPGTLPGQALRDGQHPGQGRELALNVQCRQRIGPPRPASAPSAWARTGPPQELRRRPRPGGRPPHVHRRGGRLGRVAPGSLVLLAEATSALAIRTPAPSSTTISRQPMRSANVASSNWTTAPAARCLRGNRQVELQAQGGEPALAGRGS